MSLVLLAAGLLVAGVAGLSAQTSVFFTQPAKTSAAWTSATALNTAATVAVTNLSQLTVTLSATSTMSGGSLNFEVSDGTNWYATKCFRTAGASLTGTTDATFALAVTTQGWSCSVGAWSAFRVRLNPAITGSGTATVTILSSAAPAASPVTVVSSAESLPLPTGAATSALQGVTDADDASIATGQTAAVTLALNMAYDGSVWRRLTFGTAGTPSAQVLTVQGTASMTALKVDGSAVTQPVSGTFWQATQPVSAASLPLPSGAATAAKQPALGTAGSAASDVLSVQGVASMTALKVDGSAVTQPVSGTFFQATQPASIADGSEVTLGAKADAKSAATDTTAISAISILKEVSFMEQNPASRAVTNAGTFAVQAAQSGAWNVTNVSGTVSLPTGASTAAKQPALGTAGSSSSDVLTIQGVASMTPVQVSQATASSLNATVVGTGIFATQATLQTQTDTVMVGGVNVKEVNGVAPSMGNGASGTGVQRVTLANDSTGIVSLTTGAAQIGHLEANQSSNVAQINGVTPLMGNGASGTGAQRVTIANDSTGIVALTTGSAQIGHLEANQTVNLAQVGGTSTVTGGVNGTQAVGGCVATNTATPCNPMNLGAQAVTSENTAATTAREVQLVADKVGKLIVLPYANPENAVSGVTAAMTSTTSTSIIASPGGSLRNYLTQITCTNSHATVGTFVLVQDGSGGTTIYEAYAAAVGGGFAISFPVPLVQPTTATALFVQDVTTGANVICSASGYKGL